MKQNRSTTSVNKLLRRIFPLAVLLVLILLYAIIQVRVYNRVSSVTYARSYSMVERTVNPHSSSGVEVKEGLVTFESPWGVPVKTVIRTEFDDYAVGFEFNHDIGLAVFVREGNYYTGLFLSSLNAIERVSLSLSKKSQQNNYELRRAILSSTPKMLKVTNNPFKNILLSKMLTFKGFSTPAPDDNGICTFETERICGFQFGDPGIDDYYHRVHLELYDGNGYMILVQIRGEITQEEIDVIIRSITIDE